MQQFEFRRPSLDMNEYKYQENQWPEWLLQIIREEHQLSRRQTLEAEARAAAMADTRAQESEESNRKAEERLQKLIHQEARANRFLLEAVHRDNHAMMEKFHEAMERHHRASVEIWDRIEGQWDRFFSRDNN